ncbi:MULTISPECIES: TetR/AcrR family transcriptional regulator [unclassified Streptomyces]|uniref:TetR/AcrR family transcriptional regulator n=1 Tax=unclassified Streptomyces TaxID=2593676 RepID=UPI0029A61C23|nr:TetR/AcrR family transcriptional regulator [Streptomyces sp. DK15]MDX2390340.1 TetR/AcrR family transcriptional regulator [Streptomyces sp. DK15]
MSTVRGARERARAEVTAAIKGEARRGLAAEGAAKLSLRAVARELGMVSSALYRYFPSRDELLTALIIDAYDSLGAAAEEADRASLAAGAPPRTRWIAVCGAVRGWALAHPHEWALVYGSPVPGYSAPQDTVGPASRVANTLIGILRSAYAGHGLALPPLPAALRPEADRMTAEFADGLPPEVTAALVAAWAQLVGLVSCELFGQYERVVEDRAAFYAHAAGQLAHGVGLPAA